MNNGPSSKMSPLAVFGLLTFIFLMMLAGRIGS